MLKLFSVFILLFSFEAYPEYAPKENPDYPNLEKEARLVETIEDELMIGEVYYLNDGEKDFLTIFTEADIETKATVILIHGMGSNANTAQVIHPLRTELTKKYNTLSIQMPVLVAGKISDDYRQILFPIALNRISASVKFLHDNNYTNDFLIGHSIGSAMASNYLSTRLTDFKTMVAIGMPKCVTEFLRKIDIPILDLYGERDITSVMTGIIPKREASAHNQEYVQKQVDANHNFMNRDELLVGIVTKWISDHE